MKGSKKFEPEMKVKVSRECMSGKLSTSEAARKLGVGKSTVRRWILLYRFQGADAFLEHEHNQVYSGECKLKAVRAYLGGEGSQEEIAAKYGLLSAKQLHNWIKVYKSGRGFKRKMSGGSRMKKTRKTTQAERIAIVKDCLENGSNFGEAAVKYNVSYQQVYTWVKKFTELGEAGLEDRRGQRIKDQKPRTELEKLQIENEKLKHQLYMTQMERDLLKKLDEIERRDAFRK
ncbi:MAG: helix-turn-helix domain-containing protein [Synergistaceae bacterium]|nr:helix-turn-helix domain-containing protein [Synergistaceae bacterium]